MASTAEWLEKNIFENNKNPAMLLDFLCNLHYKIKLFYFQNVEFILHKIKIN